MRKITTLIGIFLFIFVLIMTLIIYFLIASKNNIMKFKSTKRQNSDVYIDMESKKGNTTTTDDDDDEDTNHHESSDQYHSSDEKDAIEKETPW